MPTPRRLALLAAVLVPTFLVGACGTTTYDVERRQTPIHVWITAPALAEAGGTIDVLIYIAGEKIVEGPIRFPVGVPTVTLPTYFGRSGATTISAVVRDGSVAARQRVTIEGESWVQVFISGNNVSVSATDNAPNPWGR